MPLERSVTELATCLQKLHEVLSATRLTIVEDQPRRIKSAVADALELRIEDALGYTHDALEYASAASNAVTEPLDFNRARQSLSKGQKAFHGLKRCYFSELVSCEKLTELEKLCRQGRNRVAGLGAEWHWMSAAEQSKQQTSRSPIAGKT